MFGISRNVLVKVYNGILMAACADFLATQKMNIWGIFLAADVAGRVMTLESVRKPNEVEGIIIVFII